MGDFDAKLAVHVEGLRELVKGLKGSEERLDLEIRKRLKEMAQEVAAEARAMAQGLQPRVPEHVIRSLVGRAQSDRAEVKLGSNKAPDALGWEFGAAHNQPRIRLSGRYKGFNQFPKWSGNKEDAGYFLYPTIRRKREQLEKQILDIIDEVLGEGETGED